MILGSRWIFNEYGASVLVLNNGRIKCVEKSIKNAGEGERPSYFLIKMYSSPSWRMCPAVTSA